MLFPLAVKVFSKIAQFSSYNGTNFHEGVVNVQTQEEIDYNAASCAVDRYDYEKEDKAPTLTRNIYEYPLSGQNDLHNSFAFDDCVLFGANPDDLKKNEMPKMITENDHRNKHFNLDSVENKNSLVNQRSERDLS